jgi:hypothetical protein
MVTAEVDVVAINVEEAEAGAEAETGAGAAPGAYSYTRIPAMSKKALAKWRLSS